MSFRILVFLFAILVTRSTLLAQSGKQIVQMAYSDSLRLSVIFQDIHQNPELGFQEKRTAAIIEKELQRLGYEVISGIGKTGLVGILKNGAGPTVLYRADMDCNAVEEKTGLSYASKKTGTRNDGTKTPLMHGCGHDAHVVWMLGVASMMIKLKNSWKGTLIFLAQPAEELLQGAKAMVEDDMYEKGVPVPDRLVALHTWPVSVGKVINGTGIRSAGSDQLDVIFHGIGGHGSAPETTKDPILMACNAVIQYQTIISRNVSPQDIAVLTVSDIGAGSDYNVTPGTVSLKLNLRWFSDKTRNIILDGIRQINEGLAIANNLPKELYPEIRIKGTAYPLLNDTMMTSRINSSLSKLSVVKEIVTADPPIMGSEDFPVLSTRNKNSFYDYLFLGIANPELASKAIAEGKKYPFFLHTSPYYVDLSAIPLGVATGTTAALEMFRK